MVPVPPPETLKWTKQKVPEYRPEDPSSPPFLRYGHTATEYRGAAYVFGGRNEASVCNHLYRYDPCEYWYCIQPPLQIRPL